MIDLYKAFHKSSAVSVTRWTLTVWAWKGH